MLPGYMGTLLRVNLTTKEIKEEPLSPEYARDYIGGTGLGVRLAYNEVPPQTDPCGEQAKIFILTGPVTGTMLGTAGRYQMVFKSPLTGILCDSSCGGYWGAEFKKTGYDGIIIEGRSESPVYLYIEDGNAELRDASAYWGRDAISVQDTLKEEVNNKKVQILAIGQAGENGVLYSTVMHESRAVGRGGAGTVFGSKKLKAIVVRGTKEVKLANSDEFKKVAVKINKLNAKDPRLFAMREYGTAAGMGAWVINDIPAKNWQLPATEEMCDPIGGLSLRELQPHKHNACYRCTIGCSRWVKIEKGPYKMDASGPEFETLGALGSLCLIDDLELVCYANQLCNMYGVDTITCGGTIAFAMECYEKELLTIKDLDGIELEWGNGDALLEIIKKIGTNTGIGKLLGLGSRKAAKKIGKGSEEYAIHVKGMELPLHDPKSRFGFASSYATSQRGACHLHGANGPYENSEDPMPEWGFTGKFEGMSDEGKAKLTFFANCDANIFNSMVMCWFATQLLTPNDYCDLINSATGADYTAMDLLKIGKRINALHRSYNYLCGIRKKDDTLPSRVLVPHKKGGSAGKVFDLDLQLRELYELWDWDEEGKPSLNSLKELGLDGVAGDLYK